MPAARKKSLPPVTDEALALIASWFRTLAEPSRLKLLRALEEGGEMNITELVEATGLTQANVSRHVQSLVDAGMVGRRKEGLSVICFIADPSITELCDQVCSNLMERLSKQVKKLGRR
jgi:ArsR family transcriptional regulator